MTFGFGVLFGSWHNLGSGSVRSCWFRVLSHLCSRRLTPSEEQFVCLRVCLRGGRSYTAMMMRLWRPPAMSLLVVEVATVCPAAPGRDNRLSRVLLRSHGRPQLTG